MVEFGGMKKGKSVNARYAILDVWRYPVVSGVSPEHRSSDLRSDSTASAFVRLFATINDLRQAFFKTSAGRYVIRHVTSWADERYIRDVIVREGSYSIVTVNVLQAPPTAGMNE